MFQERINKRMSINTNQKDSNEYETSSSMSHKFSQVLSIDIAQSSMYSFCEAVIPDADNITVEEKQVHDFLDQFGLKQIDVKDMLSNRHGMHNSVVLENYKKINKAGSMTA